MKKSLIALAVAGAFASPAAMAEVTFQPSLYISMGAAFGSEDVGGTETQGNTVFQGGGNILGFKMTDDIGDGMKAFGQVGLTIHTNNDGGITNRYGKVGLESASFGTVFIGSGEQVYEIGQIIDGWGADYAGGASVGGGMGSSTYIGGASGTDFNFTRLDDNLIGWTSPNFSGITIDAVYVMGPSTAGTRDGEGYQAAIKWANEKLMVQAAMAAYSEYDNAGGFAGHGSGSIKADAMRVTATYDFGMLKIGGTFQMLNSEDEAVAGSDTEATSYSLTGTLPVATGRIIANITMVSDQSVGGTDVSESDASGYDIGYQHDFSKNSYGYLRYESNTRGANYGGAAGEFKHDYLMVGMKVSY